MNNDLEHLNLLKIFHYVVGALGCFFSCFPLLHVGMGLMIATGRFPMEDGTASGAPEEFGWIFVIMGGMFFLIGQATSISIILSGRYINQRTNYLFSFVVACIACVGFPFGTVLGVFTIIVLSRDTVKQLYNNQTNAA